MPTAGMGGWIRLGAAGAALFAGAWWGLARADRGPAPVPAVETEAVRRRPLATSLTAGGDLLAVAETAVECEVEDLSGAGGVAIVGLVENGAKVAKGDVICRLDASALEELARKAEILANQARASHAQAKAALEVAEASLAEYREGKTRTLAADFERRIALGRSDCSLLAKRMAWTERMVAKGYVSTGQLLSDRQEMAKARGEMEKAEGEFRLFRDYQAPKEIVSLRSKVASAEHAERLEHERLRIQERRLAHLRGQVARCTIRAPQDGVVVYDWRSRWIPIRLGALVYEGQDLFKIPDLSGMEVEVMIHETVGARVRAGMPAVVSIDAIPGRKFPGKVASILPQPIADWKSWDDRMRQYVARVRMDDTPPNLLPLMSACVEIDTGAVADALAIPVRAMSGIPGEQACFVASPAGLERRVITTGRSTPEYLEVLSGLEEGERVAVDFDEAEALANRPGGP